MSDVGQLLAGRYRLQRRIGSGGMGVVWHAVDERLQRPVAVKQLLLQPGLDTAAADAARQRTMREARIAGRLQHPNVVSVYDVTEHDGLPVLVMEYVPSRSLAELLAERGTMAPQVAAGIGAQAAAALAAAHAAGVVHRDIKPGNVLIGEDDVAKITDFGISHATGDVSVTRTGLLTGTPAYLAPEVATGKPPTPGSDVFSLAATLYEAIEGRTPFGDAGGNSLALLHKVAAGQVVPPRQAGPLTPVLTRMLHADPEQRLAPDQAEAAMRAISAGAPLPTGIQGPAAGTPPIRGVAAVGSPSGGGPGQTRVDMRPSGPWSDAGTDPRGGPPAEHGSRRPFYIVAACAAAVLLTVAVVAAALGNDGTPDQGKQHSGGHSAPAALERAVSDYYALLPQHPDNAWTHLGPRLHRQDRSEYDGYWSQVSRLSVTDSPHASGADTVQVGVELHMRDGATLRQSHRLRLVTTDGRPLIDADTMLQNERVEPSPSAHEHPHPAGKGKKDEGPKDEQPKDDGHGKKPKGDEKGPADKKH